MLPLIDIPVSRKVVATFLVSGVLALLRTLGVSDLPADTTAWIVVGAGLLAGAAVGEGGKYLNYAAERLRLPIRVRDQV